MAVQSINETDTLNQGRVKINAILQQSNESSAKVDSYKDTLDQGIKDAKKIATDAGDEAKQIAETAGTAANATSKQALDNSKTAITTADKAVSTANQNKQEFDALRNEFGTLVAESGDSNPEIVQARTDTEGIKQSTLQVRLARDFGNRMTTADAIQMFSGAVNTPKMMDYSGKTVGNVATNANLAYSDYTATSLKKPSASWNEISQENYNKLAGRDDSGVSTGSTSNSVIPQQLFKFNVIEAVKALAPNIFDGMNTAEAITFIKLNFISFTLSIRGKATAPNNKNLKVGTYLSSTASYTTHIQGSTNDFTDFTVEINDSNFIDSQGLMNVIVYSDSSNGVSPANVTVDYIGLQVIVSLNPLTVLESSGFAKKENYYNKTVIDETFAKLSDLKKENVDLGNVLNYSMASTSEAILGNSSSRYMSPKNVKEAINAQAITLTGDQDVTGKKNFGNGITLKDGTFVPTLRKEETVIKTYSSATDPGLLASGSIELQRDGNVVTCTFSFKPKSSQAANSKLIWALGTDFEPVSQIRIVTVEGFTYLYNDPADGNALKFGSALSNNQWATGTLTWIAKNKY